MNGLGITDTVIAHSLGAGRLFPVMHGVFAVGHRTLSSRGRMRAATLACGEGSVLSHRSAAALLGLIDRAPVVIDVIAPGGVGRKIGGIRRHHVPPPEGGEAGHCDGVPCTSPSRTIVDLAGVAGERELRRVAEEAAVQRCLDPDEIDRILTRRRRRGAPRLRHVLTGWQRAGEASRERPDLRSPLEARLLTRIRAADLPEPSCNEPLVVEGRRFTVDFLWPAQRLVVEVDGFRYHDNAIAFERDRLRDRTLHLDGYRVLRVTATQISGEPEAIVSAIRSLLATGPGSVLSARQ